MHESRKFYNSPKSVEIIIEQANEFVEIILSDKGLKKRIGAVYCTGYPFYNLGHTGEILPEISRFHDEIGNKLKYSNITKQEWDCIKCQSENELSDYKTMCKPCQKVDFKPRDIMKLLPDIDIFLIFDTISNDVLDRVEKKAYDNDFLPSDIDIEDTLEDVMGIFDKNSQKKLPMDMHIIQKSDLLDSLDSAMNGIYSEKVECLAMYNGWKTVDTDLIFDLLFSSSFFESIDDSEIKVKVNKFYKSIVSKFDTFEAFVNFISQQNKRAHRLLEDESILKQLELRYKEFKKLK